METRIADCPLGAKCEEVKLLEGRQVLYRCPWYTRVRGTDVNTGEEKDDWGCAIAWMPALMINTANESRKGVAATESFRNEMVSQGGQTQKILRHAISMASVPPFNPTRPNAHQLLPQGHDPYMLTVDQMPKHDCGKSSYNKE